MTEPYFRIKEKLQKAAEIAINEALSVKNGEHVLIITNPSKDVYMISQALYIVSEKVVHHRYLLLSQENSLLTMQNLL